MPAKYPTKIQLAFRSGDRCAIPKCHLKLTHDSQKAVNHQTTTIGEAAHISGDKPGSARFDPKMTDEERNAFGNLIYLCPSCHTLIDKIPFGENEYPTEMLLSIKKTHEETIQKSIGEAFSEIGFEELGYATKWISRNPDFVKANDFDSISIKEKILTNNLSQSSSLVIKMALSVVSEVKRFVSFTSEADPLFGNKLSAGFKAEYIRLQGNGYKGDELFELMCGFSTRGFRNEPERAASLAVMVYVFELCDIFET